MDNVPIVLAQYRLAKTLGIGAFGKVKCMQSLISFAGEYLLLSLSLSTSGAPYYNWSESGC
jgi:hypothetical protein